MDTKFRVIICGVLLATAMCASGCGGSSDEAPMPGVTQPPGSARIQTEPAFPNLSFASPVAMLQAPNDSRRWYVVEQVGQVLWFDNDSTISESHVFIDVKDRVVTGGEMGLLGMAFHPEFANNGLAYLSYTGPSPPPEPAISRVSQFSVASGGDALDPASETAVLSVPQDFTNHNGGQIAFAPDGFLYIGFGDGGSGNDPLRRAQDTTNILGSMLRIEVDVGTPYAVPPENPFAGNDLCTAGFSGRGEACPEIFAWGLRNPWRWSFDRVSRALWVGDVGQGNWEEVNILLAGGNYGWPQREGAHCNPGLFPADDCPTAGLIDPVVEYDHAVGRSITGGYVYRGQAIPGLAGVYLYGDFSSGRVFQYFDAGGGQRVSGELLSTGFLLSSFAEAVSGELYLLDYRSGTIHTITEAPLIPRWPGERQ